ncbi:glycosyltransferase family 1 protein [Agromyces protaetiae]|uniref:Glycosyltransferase family 1 protein n=1 Tax=Agromyces protaetiae TaxID=2509455 RepID=A0A4V0YGS3_9MICO|nr:glycosyltransferase family 1 protein [Agromyces protaetiae]QAY72211.1 glycosyltransferase family 1 protein [Agromyces protaetiae]
MSHEHGILVNGAFRDQRITGQQRYASEIADRLLRRPGVREWAIPARRRGSALGAWASVQTAGFGRDRGERLLTLTSRGPVVAPRHVVTVHDTFVLDHPEWFSRAYVATHAPVLRAQVRTAELVLAVSEPVARAIRALVKPGVEIVVAPNAPAEVFVPDVPAPDFSGVSRLAGAGGGFVLSVASQDPRKNLGRLVKAHQALPAALRERAPLVLVGGESALYARAALVHDPHVVRLGYVTDDELARLYAAASVVAFPTLAEGFGLPAVEAIAAGAEVVVSDIPVLRWVCGDDARFVDPTSVEAIAAGLRAALEDPDPAVVKARRAGAIRTRFSWQRSADTVAEAICALGSSGSHAARGALIGSRS